jgi:hypothetical protein
MLVAFHRRRAMPHYYFHVRDAINELLDPEGLELRHLEAVKRHTLDAARDTLSHEMKTGHLDLRYRIDAEDEAGAIVYSLDFKDAFSIIGNEA